MTSTQTAVNHPTTIPHCPPGHSIAPQPTPCNNSQPHNLDLSFDTPPTHHQKPTNWTTPQLCTTTQCTTQQHTSTDLTPDPANQLHNSTPACPTSTWIHEAYKPIIQALKGLECLTATLHADIQLLLSSKLNPTIPIRPQTHRPYQQTQWPIPMTPHYSPNCSFLSPLWMPTTHTKPRTYNQATKA